MNRQFYDHESSWRAEDVSKAAISVPLSAQQLDVLESAVQSVVDRGIAVEDITLNDFPLDQIQSAVDGWIDTVQQGRGLLVLQNVCPQRFSPDQCEILFYGLGCHFGEAQSQSQMGDKLGHVVNIGDKDERERAYRNSLELALHTDASDIVGMMCLVKAERGGLSGYCSAPAIYNQLLQTQPELLDILFEGYYYHLFGEQAPGESPVTDRKIPVFSECDGYLSVNYLRSYIELAFEEMQQQKTPLEQRALDVFDQIADSPAFRLDFMLEPGEITFFNNYTVLHTRTEFFDAAEPERRRHLLRLWLKARHPRPLAAGIGAFGDRKGIAKRAGGNTRYLGEAQYVESPPPRADTSGSVS